MRGIRCSLILIGALALSCGHKPPNDPNGPSATLHADAGGPYGPIIHDEPVIFSGVKSTFTVSPIARYSWNCGQEVQRAACIQDGPTPMFIYRKCGIPGRPDCNPGTDLAIYTVTLTLTNTAGTQSVATTTVTVRNKY
jgi:hypothetical protein